MKTKILILLTGLCALFAGYSHAQTFIIPSTVTVIKDTADFILGGADYWICPYASATTGAGSTTVYMEEHSYYKITNSGSNTFYVKNYAQLVACGGGGDNLIYYEPDAIITDSLIGGAMNIFIECTDIAFDYSFTLKNRCDSVMGMEEDNDSEFNIYPNPTCDVVSISVNGEKQVRVFNSIGQVVAQQTAPCRISLKEFGEGWYVITVINENGQQSSQKVCVVR